MLLSLRSAMWSFLGWKQGRYFAETNYYEVFTFSNIIELY
jgi:hypothetical protein